MNYSVFASGVIGYKNRLKSKKSQDYMEYKVFDKGTICALADGHSTEFFKYSYEGAKFACKSMISVLEKYLEKMQDLENDLEKNIIQKIIYNEWKDMVEKHYYTLNPVVFKTEYIKYGTTLIGVLISDEKIVYIKLGDGNILVKKENKYTKVIDTKKNRTVDSMGKENAHEKMMYFVDNIGTNKINNIVIFTDGYENGFYSEKEMFEDLDKTIVKYNKNIFSRMNLYKNYKKHLNFISDKRSKDDISIIFLNKK
ncbi:hypothetical protein CHF27_000190 [Romboutsia maritimum]|uniref:PPM-type phosphatase domain-containing protein n=1 Tax=Romboutsia maritimum TaxID=2020948 RepID=A0A371IVZ8_9FIRM|nr:protein phosphatase 2C domain-containing protein [Romboutsia maritimum]RDY24655.1 hypothetical protein CHF27_000190 [Romboutsia maritimum]